MSGVERGTSPPNPRKKGSEGSDISVEALQKLPPEILAVFAHLYGPKPSSFERIAQILGKSSIEIQRLRQEGLAILRAADPSIAEKASPTKTEHKPPSKGTTRPIKIITTETVLPLEISAEPHEDEIIDDVAEEELEEAISENNNQIIRRYPLLNVQQERILFRAYEREKEGQTAILLEVKKDPEFLEAIKDLSRIEQAKFVNVFDGSDTVFEVLLKCNLALLHACARKLTHDPYVEEELVQEEYFRFAKQIEKFDYKKGYRFSTFVTSPLLHDMSRKLGELKRTIAISDWADNIIYQSQIQSRQFKQQHNRHPNTDELKALVTNFYAEKETEHKPSTTMIKEILDKLDAGKFTIESLNRPMLVDDNNEVKTLEDLVPDEERDFALAVEIRKTLQDEFSQLAPHEREILFRLHMSVEEAAADMGITQRDFRMYRERVIRKLRASEVLRQLYEES